MGCWSESCAISGMGIGYDEDLYVALVSRNKYYDSRWDIVIPPIKGTYDDYGGINLSESNQQFGLQEGINWRPMDDNRGQPIYMSAEVFEFLPQLTLELGYYKGIRIKTIAELSSLYMREIKALILEIIQNKKPPQSEGKKEFFNTFKLFDIFGSRSGVIRETIPYIEDKLYSGCKDFEEFF